MRSRFFNGWRGHLLKSRARINRIPWNELVDGPESAASYELEFPEGGDNLVLGNRIEQSAQTQNPAMLACPPKAAACTAEAPARFAHLWREQLLGPLEIEALGTVINGPGIVGLPS